VLLLEVVVLFPLLCFGGMGSLASTRLSDHTLRRVLPWSCVALGFLLVFYLVAFPALRSLLAHQNLLERTLNTMLLLAPLGLLMGLPFPVALRLLSPMAETMMPWVWGVNAVACVLGSVAAVSLAIAWGLQAVVVLGAFVYVLAGCWAHRLLAKQQQAMEIHPCNTLEGLHMESAHQISVLVALGAGLLSFISPCVLPLFPAYLSFITGMSATALHNTATLRQHRSRIMLHALCFIAGFSLIFIALGASFSLLGSFLRAHLDVLQRLGGAVIVFFGLLLVGLFKVPWLMRTVSLQVHRAPVGYVGAFLVGVSFAVGWTPCIGPILGSILLLASTAAEVHRGVVLLSVYSLGLAIPFFVSSLAVPAFMQLFGRIAAYLRAIEVGGGVLMILVGLLVFTGYFTVLNSYALRLVPAWLWQYL